MIVSGKSRGCRCTMQKVFGRRYGFAKSPSTTLVVTWEIQVALVDKWCVLRLNLRPPGRQVHCPDRLQLKASCSAWIHCSASSRLCQGRVPHHGASHRHLDRPKWSWPHGAIVGLCPQPPLCTVGTGVLVWKPYIWGRLGEDVEPLSLLWLW
jgi:hypothetical protein